MCVGEQVIVIGLGGSIYIHIYVAIYIHVAMCATNCFCNLLN